MGINVGWYAGNGYSTGSAPSGVFVPSNFSQYSGSSSGDAVSKWYFCAGVQGYTLGVVEWTTVWEPTHEDPAPKMVQLSGVGSPLEIQLGITLDGLTKPAGVLTIYAVINGVTLPNKLRLVIAAGDDHYGAFSWEAFTGTVAPMTPYGAGMPGLRLPSELPACRWVGHSIEMGAAYGNVAMQTGHDRRRRVYSVVPRVVAVSWDFTLEQALAFYEWYEGPLAAALGEFSIKVANQGPGLLWWRARFVEPYTAEANESGQAFWISGKVLLVGEGTAVEPYDPDMASAVLVGLFGSAKLIVPIELGSDVVVGLLPALDMRAGIVVRLEGTASSLREDGFFVLREDGDHVLRQS